MSAPRIVVLGAGSVGCFIGGAWHAAGLDVSLIGRERIGEEIAAHGLTLSDLEGWRRSFPAQEIDFSAKPFALGRADIVALCVKSVGTKQAAEQIARHAKRKPAVISFQNGVSNADTLRRMLPKHEIIQGIVPFNIAALGKGRWHKGVSGVLLAEDGQTVRDLASRITGGPASLKPVGDIKGAAWGKLLVNLNNAVNALSGKTLLEQLGDRDYRRVVAASQIEALELLDAAGIEPGKAGSLPPRLLPHAIAAPNFLFKNVLLRVQKIDARARSSMYDDLAAGRPTEVDYLNGEVVKLAASLGRKAPINSAIVQLIRQAEAGVERAWSGKELRAHVLEGRALAPFGY